MAGKAVATRSGSVTQRKTGTRNTRRAAAEPAAGKTSPANPPAGDPGAADLPTADAPASSSPADDRPPPASSIGTSWSTPAVLDDGAGFLLGLFVWAYVVLPFLTGGANGVRDVLRAKFFNKDAEGRWLP